MSANDAIQVYRKDGKFYAVHLDMDGCYNDTFATADTIQEIRKKIKEWEDENPYPVEYGTHYTDSCFDEEPKQ